VREGFHLRRIEVMQNDKIEIEHNGEIHSFSGTTPVFLWKRGECRKALEMLMDPFHDLSDREIQFNLEVMIEGTEVTPQYAEWMRYVEEARQA